MSIEVTVEELSVSYGDKPKLALDRVSLTASPGRLLAVTGPSGAGKTSLLWTMAGLIAPRSGAVLLDGVALADRDHAMERGVVLIPQGNGLAAVLTARENVQVALAAAGAATVVGGRRPDFHADAERRVAHALESVGMSDAADQLSEELSGGQRQRVAVARGLTMRAEVLLADESTSDLDAASRDVVLGMLRAEADRGATVVIATHDPDVSGACDAEVRLADGRAEIVRG
ncbi:MAG: ABC transporter ATP-binding protein [Stackebrandtia sp.]